jgi:hypothetical protein
MELRGFLYKVFAITMMVSIVFYVFLWGSYDTITTVLIVYGAFSIIYAIGALSRRKQQ